MPSVQPYPDPSNQPIHCHLAAPSRAADPEVLVQQLPALAAVLAQCSLNSLHVQRAADQSGISQGGIAASPVHIYAASLSVARNHLQLDRLHRPTSAERQRLQALCHDVCTELSELQTLTLTESPEVGSPSTSPSHLPFSLGTLNIAAALQAPSHWMQASVREALPLGADAVSSTLRQWVNLSQMRLHEANQSMHDTAATANTLWCGAALPLCPASAEDLSLAWLTQGLSGWWQALPLWDTAQAAALNSALQTSGTVELVLSFSDRSIHAGLQARRAWKPWQKPCDLALLLAADVA